LTDHISDEEFEPIAAAMKKLPYFAPSPHFADKVRARVRVQGSVPMPVVAESRPVAAPGYVSPPARRRSDVLVTPELRRSIPARVAATALAASFGVAVTAAVLVAIFNIDLFVLVTRIFGEGAIAFIAGLGADATSSIGATAASSSAAAGTALGAAVIGSFVAGAVIATAGLKAAASASRKAA
jgi:hypothetical protein